MRIQNLKKVKPKRKKNPTENEEKKCNKEAKTKTKTPSDRHQIRLCKGIQISFSIFVYIFFG